MGPGMESALNPRTLKLMLGYVRFMRNCRQRISVGQLCAALSARTGESPQDILSHIMWLLKNDHMSLTYGQ